MTPKFSGYIKDNKLYFDKREYFDNYIQGLKDCKVEVIVKKKINRRTQGNPDEESNQNGYLWGVVYPILCSHFGYFQDEMHAAIKYKFLRKGGTRELPIIGSTGKLNKHEWECLMEDIRIWALTDFNITIPLPNN